MIELPIIGRCYRYLIEIRLEIDNETYNRFMKPIEGEVSKNRVVMHLVLDAWLYLFCRPLIHNTIPFTF
jgi:hypothetical protein